MIQGLARASEKFGGHFNGISVDTWGVDYVLLDADNRLLGYPFHYRDNRTDGILEKAYKIVPKKEIYNKTWSLMGIELPEPIINDLTLKYNFTNEGGVGNTIRFLKNIIGLWPVQECRRYWAENGKKFDYAKLAKLAEDNGPANAWINVDDPRFIKPGSVASH